jgi:hypothetical protein
MKPRHWLTTTAAFALAAVATPAFADINVLEGNNPPLGQTVQLDTNQAVGNTVVGTTNQTNTRVNFTSDEELRITSAQGQARIEASDGLFNDLTVSLADATLGFTRLILNINAVADGSVTFSGIDFFPVNDGSAGSDGPFSLRANGNNFFTVEALNGEIFKSISFASTVGIEDVSQVRIDGIAVIPEPATWAMMLFGFAAVGAAMRRRRTTRANVRFNFA